MKRLIWMAALLAGTAQAEFLDGNDLLEKINANSLVDNMVAMGYVMGVSDASRNVFYCNVSNGVTAGQMRDIVKNYLIRNPQIRHHTADTLVGRALGEAWPCPNNRNRNNL